MKTSNFYNLNKSVYTAWANFRDGLWITSVMRGITSNLIKKQMFNLLIVKTQWSINFQEPCIFSLNEPPRGKTNNVVSEQV